MNFNIDEIIGIIGGELLCGNRAARLDRICTDTRKIQPGETFLAINGPRFRGDDFIREAVYRGASGVISSHRAADENFPADRYHIYVEDTTEALGNIARAWRRKVNPYLIALSGSAGKTTTKEMLAHLCSQKSSTLATQGNLNNLIGLPMTLLRLDRGHEIAVIETGINHSRELARLTEICEPNVAVLTNIGNAHIGNFGSLDDLIRAKGEILEGLRPEGIAILNADCPNTARLSRFIPMPRNRVTFGLGAAADVRAEGIIPAAPVGYQFFLCAGGARVPVTLPVYGRYQVANALAAAAAAITTGMTPEEAASALNTFKAPQMRSHTEWQDGVLVISDHYNASPDAMIKSLCSLSDVSGIRRRVALLGGMNELGEHAEPLHREAGRAVANVHLDILCAYGTQARWIAEEAQRGGVQVHVFEDGEEAAHFLAEILREGDALLAKASRTIGLENVVERVRELRHMRSHQLAVPAENA